MADILNRGSLLPEEVVTDLINTVVGESSLAQLAPSKPIAFNGQREYTFSLDREVDIVAESGAKSKGGVTVTPVTIVPIKIEYGARVSDEFIYGAEEVGLDIMTAFADGFAKKAARGFDIAAYHGANPRTAAASAVIGGNNFDAKITNVVTQAETDNKADTNVESAIALVQGGDRDVSGIAMAPSFRSDLAAQTDTTGRKLYPELAWGQKVGSLNGLLAAANSSVSFNAAVARAYVGDFANAFRWGYSKEIPVQVIEYGNPDNDETLGDLKGHNQVYLRGEMYIGWGILIPSAFAKINAYQA